MRPIRETVSAVGNSQWVPINYLQRAIQIGLAVVPWSTATGLTCVVQETLDDISASNIVTIARVTTTATVTDTGPLGLGHGLSTGDSVIIKGSGSTNLDSPLAANGNGDLGVTVTVTSATQYTYTVANSGPTAATAKATQLRVATVTGFTAVSTRTVGNIGFPVTAVRLAVSALTAGAVDLLVLQGL